MEKGPGDGVLRTFTRRRRQVPPVADGDENVDINLPRVPGPAAKHRDAAAKPLGVERNEDVHEGLHCDDEDASTPDRWAARSLSYQRSRASLSELQTAAVSGLRTYGAARGPRQKQAWRRGVFTKNTARAVAQAREEEARQRALADAAAYFREVDEFTLMEVYPDGACGAAPPDRPAQDADGATPAARRESDATPLLSASPASAPGSPGSASDVADDLTRRLTLARSSMAAPRRSSILLVPPGAAHRRSTLGRSSMAPPAAGGGRRSTMLPVLAPLVEGPGHEANESAPLLSLAGDSSCGADGDATTAAGAAADAGPAETEAISEEPLPPLAQLLEICGQHWEADARGEVRVAKLPSMDDLLAGHVDLQEVRKIGEGTFGEAFKYKDRVVKIVPMGGDVLVNGEVQKTPAEMLAEAAVTIRLSDLRAGPADDRDNATSAFVEAFEVGVCRGGYSKSLLREWRAWDKAHVSENDDPGALPEEQLYVVFVVADGGADLERFKFRGFEECRSMLLQTCLALACAEGACEFEHRDLHWGNLLLRRDGAREDVRCRLNAVDITAQTSGVRCTLIDFTLSRLVTEDGCVACCDLSADPELFKGPKGNCQADTYRKMRNVTGGRWAGFFPKTNCLWMAYLAECLLSLKNVPVAKDEKRALRRFASRAAGCASCVELVWDPLFAGLWTTET